MKNAAKARARQRLDERVQFLRHEERLDPPARGWVRAIREALGMTGVQFAKRLGISPQSAEALEKSEATGTAQLNTLRRAAEALDCRLIYALVPKTSFESAVNDRARKIALRDLRRAAHTMALEAQGTGDADLEDRIQTYVRDTLNERDLWNES
jgi:predicted DNA-binding mobile mystery protein A